MNCVKSIINASCVIGFNTQRMHCSKPSIHTTIFTNTRFKTHQEQRSWTLANAPATTSERDSRIMMTQNCIVRFITKTQLDIVGLVGHACNAMHLAQSCIARFITKTLLKTVHNVGLVSKSRALQLGGITKIIMITSPPYLLQHAPQAPRKGNHNLNCVRTQSLDSLTRLIFSNTCISLRVISPLASWRIVLHCWWMIPHIGFVTHFHCCTLLVNTSITLDLKHCAQKTWHSTGLDVYIVHEGLETQSYAICVMFSTDDCECILCWFGTTHLEYNHIMR